ncbi:MAG: hypothetical protein GXO49_06380 [Chlorobi bacterium]|nr:hypothetical protein [Chlorobiota bacterium]
MFKNNDLEIAKKLLCPKCGYAGDIVPVEGEIYHDGTINPPHFECLECYFKGFEHDFKKRTKSEQNN